MEKLGERTTGPSVPRRGQGPPARGFLIHAGWVFGGLVTFPRVAKDLPRHDGFSSGSSPCRASSPLSASGRPLIFGISVQRRPRASILTSMRVRPSEIQGVPRQRWLGRQRSRSRSPRSIQRAAGARCPSAQARALNDVQRHRGDPIRHLRCSLDYTGSVLLEAKQADTLIKQHHLLRQMKLIDQLVGPLGRPALQRHGVAEPSRGPE
jgi:hypothetical protein